MILNESDSLVYDNTVRYATVTGSVANGVGYILIF